MYVVLMSVFRLSPSHRTSMSLFASYEKEFSAHMAELTQKNGSVPDLVGEAKAKEIKSAEKLIDECQELLEQMDMEIADLPADSRGAMKQRLAGYRANLQNAEKGLRKAAVQMSTSKAARDELFAFDGSSEDAREALLSNTERLGRTSKRLEEGHKIALETTEVAVEIMGELQEQREKIQRSRARLKDVDSGLGKAGRVLTNMISRGKRNKAAAIAIIVLGVGLIAILIYLMATK